MKIIVLICCLVHSFLILASSPNQKSAKEKLKLSEIDLNFDLEPTAPAKAPKVPAKPVRLLIKHLSIKDKKPYTRQFHIVVPEDTRAFYLKQRLALYDIKHKNFTLSTMSDSDNPFDRPDFTVAQLKKEEIDPNTKEEYETIQAIDKVLIENPLDK